MTEVVITYEALYEVLRREKARPDLQKLEPEFWKNVTNYLKEKNEILSKEQESLFAKEENKKVRTQIEQALRIIKELYARREQKILQLSLDVAKLGKKTMDTNALLEEEKQLFENLVKMLNEQRKETLHKVLEMQEQEPKALKIGVESGSKKVRFVASVPKFIGTDLQTYGPFEEENIAKLPADVADLLIKKEKAEEIK